AIFGDHARGGKSLRVLERLGTPAPALFGIGESQQIGRKIFFIVWLVQQGSCARDVRHRTGRAAHDGATARLRLNNRPAESFEPTCKTKRSSYFRSAIVRSRASTTSLGKCRYGKFSPT